jgi:hypothetical protein
LSTLATLNSPTLKPTRTLRVSPQARTRRNPSTILFIAVQLLPLVLLGIVYTRVSGVLAVNFVNGVSMQELLLASAVAGPILGQTVSGPVFRALEGVSTRSLSAISVVTLRNLPKAIIISAPAVALADVGLAAATNMTPEGAVALAGVLEVHLIFAGTLVAAFARRSALMISVAWIAYGSALLFFPTLWWAPAAAGFASQLVILAIASRLRLRGVVPAKTGAMLLGLLKGLAQSIPLWALPVALYVTEPDSISPAVVFAALIPALLAYHIYFSTVATPLWRMLDEVRKALSTVPYAEAQKQILSVSQRASRGELRVAGVVLIFGLVLIPATLQTESSDSFFIVALIAASGLSVVLTAQLTRLSMLREGPGFYIAAGVITANLVFWITLGASPVQLLLAHSVLALASITVVSIANRQMWRIPEHALFWRTALSQ